MQCGDKRYLTVVYGNGGNCEQCERYECYNLSGLKIKKWDSRTKGGLPFCAGIKSTKIDEISLGKNYIDAILIGGMFRYGRCGKQDASVHDLIWRHSAHHFQPPVETPQLWEIKNSIGACPVSLNDDDLPDYIYTFIHGMWCGAKNCGMEFLVSDGQDYRHIGTGLALPPGWRLRILETTSHGLRDVEVVGKGTLTYDGRAYVYEVKGK